MAVIKRLFDTYQNQPVYAYEMKNHSDISAVVLSFGGILNRLYVPDRNGNFADIVTGFDSVNEYLLDASNYSGALVGRYANRMGQGGFSIAGQFFPVENNDKGIVHLHGGNTGFSRRIWGSTSISSDREDSVILSLFSPDGEDGYPGNLKVTVTYTLKDDNSLTIHYEAETDRATILNLTNHAYYNLAGYQAGTVFDHRMTVQADRYDPVGVDNLPHGEPQSVDDTVFDFRTERAIENAYDHCFHLCYPFDGTLHRAVTVYEPLSGRLLTLDTDYPAVQIYTAEYMNNPVPFKGNVEQRPFHAFALETQFAPDTPHRPYLPSCRLNPGEKFDKRAVFTFGIHNG